ncbi:MAG: glycosyltransferase family 28 [Nocardioidaceae bacterium]|nr:glycosyltransferase family 28 [Nocardioidaceae bacterium]
MTRPRLLFYCQHSVGLGHLVRSMNLADGLAADFDVTLLNGGPWPRDVPQPAGIEIVHLPPLGMDADYALVSRDDRYTVEEAVALRTRMVLEVFHRTRPDVVLVELFPFGRKKFRFELVPLLEAARAAHHAPFVACSLRDILVGSRRAQQAHDDRASRVANELFDAVLVHADERFATLEESFHPTVPLRTPVHYTGFVRGADDVRPPAERQSRVLVSAGGGLVGEPLFRAAVDAHPRLLAEHGLRTTIVTGPFLPEPVVDDLVRQATGTAGLEVLRYLPDLGGEMAASAVSVSQVGYNTTMDILGSQTPAVVVPYSAGREDEQSQRAHRLERLGALRVLDADALSGPTLADAVRDALGWRPLPVPLDLDGRTRTAALLRGMLPVRESEPVR